MEAPSAHHTALHDTGDSHTYHPQQSSVAVYRGSPAASLKQLPSISTRHFRNRLSQPSAPAILDNTTEYRKLGGAVEIGELHRHRGVQRNRANDTGLPAAVLPGTGTLQLPDTRGDSSCAASCTLSANGALKTGTSRSQSRVRSASIGSVKEDVADIPQSFIEQSQNFPPSPDSHHTSSKDTTDTRFATPNFYFPSASFMGWKQVELGGKRRSKSSNDLAGLTTLQDEWLWASENQPKSSQMNSGNLAHRKVGIEDMPFEILDMILCYLLQDLSPDSYGPRNGDLIACLLASRTMHAATLSVLYKHVTIPFSITFSKMLNHISKCTGLGTLVRRLDFSHYTSVGFGRTRRDSWEIQNLTPKTFLRCLELFTNLKEFLVHEHIDDELDEEVLKKLFSMPSIHAMDFCACLSRRFVSGFTANTVTKEIFPVSLTNLKRLGLHACTTLQAPVFEALLPWLTNLTHLDVGMTLITDAALLSIPQSARITHLGLGKCTRITGSKVVEFLTTHAAVKDSLVFLNIMADLSRYLLLSDGDVERLLPRLPSTMRSLNIGGAQVSSKHVPLLLRLTKHLEELGLSNASLTVADLNSFFIPSPPSDDNDADISEEEMNWEPCALRYLDLTAVHSVTQTNLFGAGCLLASPHSFPLEVIELCDPVIQQLQASTIMTKRLGWVVKELGRRGWFVRLPTGDHIDDGRRNWKMGARWWGMRKVPVAIQEVGGMYGHYMFKS